MGDVLTIVGIASGLALVPFGAFAFVRWRLRRRLRVSPRSTSPAPLVWLVSMTTPARLHRRLRDATSVARLARRNHTGDAADEIAQEIERQALALERHLVLAARLRRDYGPSRRAVAGQISQLEGLASRLAHAAVEADRDPTLPSDRPEPLARIAERLDALHAARAELSSIELNAGLAPTEPPRPPLRRPTPPPPRPSPRRPSRR